MNTKNYFLPLLLLILVFTTSCEETKEVGKYDNWRERNEAFIDSLQHVYDTKADHGGLEFIHLISAPNDVIYFKRKKPVALPGEEPIIKKDVKPLFTDVVSLFYKGSFIIGSVDEQNNYIGEVFDGNFTGANPDMEVTKASQMKVRELITGFTEILQRMDVGERYEIYIPWQYGYGSSDNKSILAYSTLIFDVQLLDIVK